MEIIITGPSGGQPYDKNVALKIESAVLIMATKLGIAHIPMCFDVMLGRTVSKTDGDCEGWCFAKQYRKSKPWEVSIFVWRKKRFRDMIKTLAHEMIHVKQHELDGLELTLTESFFRGQKWLGEYWFSPWEVEARGYELAFLQHYLHWIHLDYHPKMLYE